MVGAGSSGFDSSTGPHEFQNDLAATTGGAWLRRGGLPLSVPIGKRNRRSFESS